MSKEHKSQPAPRRPYDAYGFTEKERLKWRVNQERFKGILNDERTTIHEIQESSNSFGEFLFVTTSRQTKQGRVAMTFYGMGFHDCRERWITKHWYWYQASTTPNMMKQQLAKDEADELLKQRQESIQPYIDENTQTDRGRLFELLAELTDEDGALAELQDLGDNWERLLGDFDG